MEKRRQNGWLKREQRAEGETYCFFVSQGNLRASVPKTRLQIGLVKEFFRKSDAWSEVE